MPGIITWRVKPPACYFCKEESYIPVNDKEQFLEEEMTTETKNRIPWYLWPFAALWKLLAVIVEMTGRLVAMVLGIVLMIVGVLVSLTIVGAIVGVPLAVVGLLLFIKGIF
jgi:hypothetical protein